MGRRSSGGPSIYPESAFRAHPEVIYTRGFEAYKIYHAYPVVDVSNLQPAREALKAARCRLPNNTLSPRGKIGCMEEEFTKVNEDVRGDVKVTINEAATLLGVHPNTVRSRVKAGIYVAERVSTEHGLTWMIDRGSLVNLPPPRASQQPSPPLVKPEAAASVEAIQELLKPLVEDLGRTREELGAERVRRELAERERDELAARITKLQEPRESSEEPIDIPKREEGSQDTEGPETSVQPPKRSWWRRFFGFD